MPRITRSCKDLSINEVQTVINFPQRKSNCQNINLKKQPCTNNNNIDNEEIRKPSKPTQKKRSTRKRIAENDENAGSPVKSPRKVLTPLKSPLIDRSNVHNNLSPGVVKRKLDLSDENKECKPPVTPLKQTMKIKQPICGIEEKQTKSGVPVYSKIRQSLHTSAPLRLVSREKELNTIREFIQRCLVGSQTGSLYMSGAPGTGKTACLTKILDEYKGKTKTINSVFLNCMSLKQSQSIFSKLVEELMSKTCLVKDAIKQLEKHLTTKGPKILLILDEIDQLESKNQEILYRLFEMPFLPKSRLVLVGIANALDLTDRILPRLQSRATCKPMLLQFPPYSKDEIAIILQERIQETQAEIVDKMAIQFCARKVSAMTGDVRKALDILRRSIEVVESEWKKDHDTPADTKNMKKITVAHVASVCAEVYGSRISTPKSKMAFPLQQKLVICTLMVCLKDKKIKEVTNAKLYESYCRVCRSRQITPVSQEEFGGLCTLLDSQGIITVKQMKDIRNNKFYQRDDITAQYTMALVLPYLFVMIHAGKRQNVNVKVQISLRLQETEVEFALQDKTLLSAILAGGIQS